MAGKTKNLLSVRQLILQKDGTEWPCQLTVHAMEFGEQQEWVYTVTACPESEQLETTVKPAETATRASSPHDHLHGINSGLT